LKKDRNGSIVIEIECTVGVWYNVHEENCDRYNRNV
jgi:hypothetical protein